MSRESAPHRSARNVLLPTLLLWIFGLGSEVLAAQEPAGVIAGTIKDAVTGGPVTLATLSMNGGVATLTDREGRFRIERVEWGTNVLQVRRIGYAPVEIDVWVDRPNDEFELSITLAPAPTELDPISVEGEATPVNRKLIAFEDRRRMGFGHFVTTEQIEAWNPSNLTDVLQKAPGVIVRPNPGYLVGRDYRKYLIQSTRRVGRLGPVACEMIYYLDGMFMGTQGPGEAPIDSWVNIGSLAAIEIYSGASQVPAQFNRSGAACGVVVLWTR